MSIIDLLVLLFFLYMAYSVLRWVLINVWALVVWGFSFIDPRPAAQIRRIVKRAEAQHEAISRVYLSELREASKAASRDILRSK
jgi:hypothetical protein